MREGGGKRAAPPTRATGTLSQRQHTRRRGTITASPAGKHARAAHASSHGFRSVKRSTQSAKTRHTQQARGGRVGEHCGVRTATGRPCERARDKAPRQTTVSKTQMSHPPHAWPRPETRRHAAPPAPPHQYRWFATQREAVPWLGSHHPVSHLPACSLTPETRGASGTAPSQMARHAARSCSVARIACAR